MAQKLVKNNIDITTPFTTIEKKVNGNEFDGYYARTGEIEFFYPLNVVGECEIVDIVE